MMMHKSGSQFYKKRSRTTCLHCSGSRENSNRGFTLIELLAVLLLIAVLGAIIGFSFRGGNESVVLQSSERMIASMAEVARAQALLKQQPTRLVISNDENDVDRFHRYMTVVSRNDSPGLPEWTPLQDGVYLPGESYFNEAKSQGEQSGIMDIQVGVGSNNSGRSWIYFEFDSLGRPKIQGATVIVGLARREDVGENLIFNEEQYVGVILLPTGGVLIIDDPSHLP